MTGFWRREEGQSLIEFALSSLIVFMLLIFILDGGRILWQYVTLSQATGVATRYCIVHGTKSSAPIGSSDTAIIKQVILSAVPGISSSDLTVTATYAPDNNPGGLVTIALRYQVRPLTNLVWPGMVLTLNSNSTAVIQN
jgi:Flp pilus assembly protein TadG